MNTIGGTPLPRETRINLAVSYYGLYMFGMAVTQSERVDEDCAMDNAGIPYYEDQLTEAHKAKLEHLKSFDVILDSALKKSLTTPAFLTPTLEDFLAHHLAEAQ